MSQETVNWIVGLVALGFIGMTCIFLKSLHSKIEGSVSTETFNATIAALRSEYGNDRKEIRENQIKIFERLEAQQQILTKLLTTLEIMKELRPFDQTWPSIKAK